VYSREIDDTVLTLSASGWTFDFTFVLYDYETESMWFPVNIGDPGSDLECGCVLWGIAGEYAGEILPALPSENTFWNEWYADHPLTKIMVTPSKSAPPQNSCDQ